LCEITSDELSNDFTVPFAVWVAGVLVFFAAWGTAAKVLPATASATTSARVVAM
jgi:hypothetical protein